MDCRGRGILLIHRFTEKPGRAGHAGMGPRKANRSGSRCFRVVHLPEVVIAPLHDVAIVTGVVQHSKNMSEFMAEDTVAGLGLLVAWSRFGPTNLFYRRCV